jgi:predicted nucleotidyltransferase
MTFQDALVEQANSKAKHLNTLIKVCLYHKRGINMLTPKQTRIFEAFLRNPYKEMTFRDIKEYGKEKSNSAVQKAIARFLADELILKREVGNIILYKANLDNSSVFSYFDILVKEKLPKAVKLCLKLIKEETRDIAFISIVLLGSYAEGKQTEKSDLDIALFVDSEEDKRKCRLAMKSAGLKCPLRLDTHVFTKDEMLEMLKDKKENLGKQIARKHAAVHNAAAYYSIINEGIENGFKVMY